MAIRMLVHEKGPNVEESSYRGEPILMAVSYEGCVVDTGEVNGYDDSDFFAVVYDAATDTFKRVIYATTRGWTYCNSAVVDAPPELVAKYTARVEAEARAKEAARLTRGKTVEVVRGRKVPLGTRGTVFWLGDGRYGARVGIETPAGRVFTSARNVKVVPKAAPPPPPPAKPAGEWDPYSGPPPGSWASIAREMARSGLMSGEEADRWKDEMKEAACG